MARFLLTPFGSAGDVNPFLWLGRHLLDRGHEVEMITAPMFQDFAEKSGIAFSSIGDAAEFDAILHHPDLWKPYHGTAIVFEYSAKFLRRTYDLIAARMHGSGAVLVSPFHQFASRLAREKFSATLVGVHLQPACFLSMYDTPLLIPGTGWLNKLPRWFKRLIFSLPNPAVSRLAPTLRRVCADLGVTPPRRVIPDWIHSPDLNLALFPEWFAPPQPDWPPHTHTIGFPLEDMKGRIAIPTELEAWLSEGDKPVLFSPGSGNTQARDFFREGIKACQRLGLRVLLGTRYPEQLPSPLPACARHFDYLPFSALLPRVATLVHHGGIGTLSQALAAGVPQLVMPMGHDQPDNARRMTALGVGDALPPRRFTAQHVASSLRRLIASPDVAAACNTAARRCAEAHPSERAIALLEQAAARTLPA